MKDIIIEIPQYLRHVQLSAARRIKYYDKSKAAPKAKKYADRTKYDYQKFVNKYLLVDLATGERVIANPKAAGTPNVMIINGQKIYNGEMNPNTRAKVMSMIKDSFKPYIDALDEITEFPLKMEIEIHGTIRGDSGSLWDADNRSYPYIKAFQDCLTGNRDKEGNKRCKQIIVDDNILFVSRPPAPIFIPIESEEDRKLVFIIRKETDPRILNNFNYQQELDEELLKYINK